MITKEFAETATEINVIFDNLSNDILSKIPEKVKIFFKDNASDSYNFEYDKSKTLSEQDLKPKTKGIISLLYRDYICDEIEKQEFMNEYNMFLDKKEQVKQELYNPDNLFKNTQNNTLQEEALPVVYEESKWYTKIFNFIKHIFFKSK